MLKSGILNPHLLALLGRVRHTNTLVIADRGFPSWPQVETLDLSLTANIPTVLQVLEALHPQWDFRTIVMAEEFRHHASPAAQAALGRFVDVTSIHFEPHHEFKQRVPMATAIIRTADCIPYSNMILESA